MKKIILEPLCCFEDILEIKFHPIDVSLCKDGKTIFLLQELKQDGVNYKYLWERLMPNYRIVSYEKGIFKDLFAINNAFVDYHFIRDYGDALLLASARCRYISESNIEKNAHLYSVDGSFVESFVIGDGIEDIKIDQKQNIWISYGDEGVYGNYGWDEPFGVDGLICLNKDKKIVSRYRPSKEHNRIDDCYAMTIDTMGSTWFYYYSEFVLCCIDNNGLDYFTPQISGVSNILVSNDFLILDEGYSKKDSYVVFEKNRMKQISKIFFEDENGEKLGQGFKYFSDSKGLIINKNKVYFFDLSKFTKSDFS